MKCDWAACRADAVTAVEGWWMCAAHKAEHYALKRPEREPIPPSQRAEVIRELHAQGYTDQQMAALIGRSRHVIQQQRMHMGLPPLARSKPAEILPCGTPAAYRRHIRRGEQACDPCLQAESVRVSEGKRRRSA